MSTEPLKNRTIDELLERAAECESMADGASTVDTAAALLRLAERFRETARRRAGALVHQPGEPASQAGHYEQLNIFGTPTGTTMFVQRGNSLPAAPIGFTWRLKEAR